MDTAATPDESLLGTHGFVHTVQLNNTTTDTLWSKSTGISFVVFMVIGFSATLVAIGITFATYLCYRRCRRLRAERQTRDVEAAATIPEPKEMYLVVHPGGSADVAHKDLDDSPRKMILRNKPIQLSSAVLDFNPSLSLPAEPEAKQAERSSDKEASGIKVVNLTADSRLHSGAPARLQRVRLDSVDMTDSPKIMACHPRELASPEARRQQHMHRVRSPMERLRQSEDATFSRQSSNADSCQDEALLLTPRFPRS